MSKKAMKLALDLATMHHTDEGYAELRVKVRVAIKEVLAQPQDRVQGLECVIADLKAECQALRAAPVQQQQGDTERLDWLNNNFFNRENLDWYGNVSKESLMWVFFAPVGVQAGIRRVIDAAMAKENT